MAVAMAAAHLSVPLLHSPVLHTTAEGMGVQVGWSKALEAA